MSDQIKTRVSVLVLTALAVLLLVAGLQKVGWAQACTSVRLQGYLGGCDNIYLKFLPVNHSSEIRRFDILLGGSCATRPCTKVGEAPANATFFNHTGVGCGAGGTYTIRQVMTTCTAQYSGNLPHNRPCDQCSGVGGGSLATANSASFQSALAADAIGTAFSNVDLTTETVAGYDAEPQTPGYQLPKELGGVRLFLDGIQLGLFWVSPRQINFHVPPNFPQGNWTLTAATISGQTITGTVLINKNAPGIFTREQNGSGQAMALWYQFRNGVFYRIWPAGSLPANEILTGDRMFYVVFATGINSGRATMRVNNRVYESLYAGDVPLFIALDQVNFEIPLSQLWVGDAGAQVTVYDEAGNFWLSNGFMARGVEPTR